MKKSFITAALSLVLMATPVTAQSQQPRGLGDIYADELAALGKMVESGGADVQAGDDLQRYAAEGIALIDGSPIPECGREVVLATREAFFMLSRGVDLTYVYNDAVRRSDTTVIDQTHQEMNYVIGAGYDLMMEIPTLAAESTC